MSLLANSFAYARQVLDGSLKRISTNVDYSAPFPKWGDIQEFLKPEMSACKGPFILVIPGGKK